MTYFRSLTIALAIFCSACAAPPQRLSTTSGNPEIFLSAVTRKQVADVIVAAKLSAGMTVRSTTEYSVVVGKRLVDNYSASVAYGSRYDSVPEMRTTYNFVEQGGGVAVFGRVEMITNPGSAYERVHNVTASQGATMQRELEDLKAKLNR